MAWFLLRKSNPLRFLARAAGFQTYGFRALEKGKKIEPNTETIRRTLSPSLPFGIAHPEGFDVELVDSSLWLVSSAMPESSKASLSANNGAAISTPTEEEEEVAAEGCLDFDEIEEMRLHKNLFYKLDRDSREYEEYNHLLPRGKKKSSAAQSSSIKEESKEKGKSGADSTAEGCGGPGWKKKNENEKKKKVRNLTYNQLTDPYHLPFCLDIYISKASIRACVVHRATSKVVAVAHSISKDMKFDLLTSRKNAKACAAVGEALAQRAIADDIHNLVYTPRRGEKIEGKLQIVLESIIGYGIHVKVKIKQRRILKRIASQNPSMTNNL